MDETPTLSPLTALYVDTSPSRHDDQSSTSSHSTVRASHSYPSTHHRSVSAQDSHTLYYHLVLDFFSLLSKHKLIDSFSVQKKQVGVFCDRFIKLSCFTRDV